MKAIHFLEYALCWNWVIHEINGPIEVVECQRRSFITLQKYFEYFPSYQ
jgi:hypothetical protein